MLYDYDYAKEMCAEIHCYRNGIMGKSKTYYKTVPTEQPSMGHVWTTKQKDREGNVYYIPVDPTLQRKIEASWERSLF